jgi:hypothetical protein
MNPNICKGATYAFADIWIIVPAGIKEFYHFTQKKDGCFIVENHTKKLTL